MGMADACLRRPSPWAWPPGVRYFGGGVCRGHGTTPPPGWGEGSTIETVVLRARVEVKTHSGRQALLENLTPAPLEGFQAA